MNLIFNIEYRTDFGEGLLLNIVSGAGAMAHKMTTVDGRTWSCTLGGRLAKGSSLLYYYSVEKSGKETRREWQVVPHMLELACEKGARYTVYDRWIDMPEDTYLYSSAYTDCIARRTPARSAVKAFARTVRIKVRAPQLRRDERLALCGEGPALGGWDTAKAVPMTEHCHNEWVADIDAGVLEDGRMEFKFVAIEKPEGKGMPRHVMWEDGLNRTIELAAMKDGDVAVYELDQSFFPICNQKFAGTLVPVFSLRSRSSFGVGDFGDLKKMIDWVAATGQRILQVLPVNDTTINHTWTDSYPYSCISIFALHPQYADLGALPPLEDREARKRLERTRLELNALRQIDYERVNNAKNEYLALLFGQEGRKVLRSAAFKRFFEESQQWLVPYAQFCYLRDRYGTGDYSQWPDHNVFDEADRKALSSPRTHIYKEVSYFYFVQFVLYTQMSDAHEYARSKGVVLKGDIPIGVNRHGCDAWQEPGYFNLDGQAGAPPDDFSVNGQNWGFPTYNWEEMQKDDCAWWVRRFSNMAKFFDAYRIDHVLGFFRIWEIPIHAVHGLLGQFSPALGMTREEIEAYGLRFQEELFTEPFITDWVLERVFGERAGLVRDAFLEPIDGYRYRMKDEYGTQRKVEAAFSGRTDDGDVTLRDGLYSLISDVLFVRDHRCPNKFHPRISVHSDFVYESLHDSDKFVFNRLYDDYFYRRNNHFWYREATRKLPKLIQATRMLVCAEDLGMVPDCVPWVMNELRILSLELQSMPKETGTRFGHLERYPYRSVCTISSHDMPTLRQWWDEDWERTQEYYATVLHREDKAPHPLPGWLARDIISRHLTCPSMLCVLSIQDWLAIDEGLRLPDQNAERINIPANPRHYWRYRMHVDIEDLLGNESFNKDIRGLIRMSGRK